MWGRHKILCETDIMGTGNVQIKRFRQTDRRTFGIIE